MTQQISWERSGNTLRLQGVLEQDTLVPLWEARHEATTGMQVIALNGLERVDTAGLALLIQFAALAKQQGHALRLEGGSENLLTLAKLYNLPENLIPLPAS